MTALWHAARNPAALATLALSTSVAGCKCQPANRGRPAPSASSAGVAPKRKRSVRLRPLAGARARQDLAVANFQPAVVIAPLGTTDSRPVLIVLHGQDVDPVAVCEAWHKVSGYGFVLCPRGVVDAKAHGGSALYTLGDVHDTVLELRGALIALRKRFGDYVAPGPVVLAGVALGALRAVSILRQEPSYFARVVLVQRQRDAWNSGVATIFARRGGRRVLFVCTASACAERVRDEVVLTRRAGAQARASAPGDHAAGFDARLASAITPDFRWLVADDPSWKPPPSPP